MNDFVRQFSELDLSGLQDHILSQVHATSIIASEKFKHVKRALIGTVFITAGWIIALAMIFLQ